MPSAPLSEAWPCEAPLPAPTTPQSRLLFTTNKKFGFQDPSIPRQARHARKPRSIHLHDPARSRLNAQRRGECLLLPRQRRSRVCNGDQPRSSWWSYRLMKQYYSSCFTVQLVSSSIYPKMRTVAFCSLREQMEMILTGR